MSEEFVGVMGCMRSNVGDLSQSNAGALGRWILVKVMPVVWSLGNAGLPPQHREVSLATISLIVMHLHHLGSPQASPSSSQRRKNLGGRVALPPRKFLRVRKVFARNP